MTGSKIRSEPKCLEGEQSLSSSEPSGSSLPTSELPIRVCLVSPFPPPYGGMAIQAEKLVRLLRESGVEVTPIRTNVDLPGLLKWVDKIAGVRTVLRTMVFLVHLQRILKKTDTVYFLSGFFYFFFWVTYPALILIKMNGKPVVLNGRGGAAQEFFDKYRLLLKPVISRVDAVSVPSGFLKKAFCESFGIRASIVPNIADLAQFSFRERKQIRPNLLVTRSLAPIYNVGCVIKAFRIVRMSYPDARLGIVGDGSERKDLEDLVMSSNLQDAVTFYGIIEHHRIQELYHKYDISVNASNVDNLPGTILEAFACGLPVVSTNAGGIPYMVKDGVTGLLVEKEDYESLAQRIIYLIENPDLAQKLVRNARAECLKYSEESVKKELISLLKQVVHESKRV